MRKGQLFSLAPMPVDIDDWLRAAFIACPVHRPDDKGSVAEKARCCRNLQ